MSQSVVTVWYIRDLVAPIVSASMFARLAKPEGWEVDEYCPDTYIFLPSLWRV